MSLAPISRSTLFLALGVALALAGPPAAAQESRRVGNSLGVAALWENELYRGLDASVTAYPFATWRAGRFFLRGPGLGVELGDYGRLNLSAAADTLGRHDGQELELQWSYPLGRVEGQVRARWQSDALVDYYYGVTAGEARPDRPAYEPGSGLTWSLGLLTAAPLGKRWLLFVGANIDLLPDAIQDSPIVDGSTNTRVFGALAWRFD
jgi:outer membrane scaffolding protein for murein synthesis (MipA/OmpV family)